MTYILSASYEPGFPIDWEGLDYESANDATPKLYAVSSGDGNDGVSHMYPDYYCRTNDPFGLARLATITSIRPAYQNWAAKYVEVDGEAEYTISATLYDPPDSDNWSEHNGAWIIVEVFLIDEKDITDTYKMKYDNLNECFGADVVERFND